MRRARPGACVAYVAGALANLGAMLETDPAARAGVEAATETSSAALLPSAQAQLADFIAQVVGGWDAKTITERLEYGSGKIFNM